MNEYPLHVKNCLLAVISQITARKNEFVKHPDRDFSRNRKISLNRMILFLVGAEASTMQFELQKFSFLFSKSISGLPSCSAMFQQRSTRFVAGTPRSGIRIFTYMCTLIR